MSNKIGDFSVISTLTTLFSWNESMSLISLGLSLKKASNDDKWRERRKRFLLLFALLITFLDVIIDWRASYGDIGSLSTLVAAAIFLLYDFFLISFVILVRLIFFCLYHLFIIYCINRHCIE